MTLTKEQIVTEALALVDEKGLDAVTLRALAARLGVQAPTLYWHLRDKAELMDALADAVMADAIAALPARAGDWREWLVTAASALRRGLLSRRDGARIVAGARDSMGRADFSEAVMKTLVDAGVPLQRARLLVLATERFTVGAALEEQAPPRDRPGPGLPELRQRLPTATRAIIEYFAAGRTVDDAFVDVVRAIVGLAPLA